MDELNRQLLVAVLALLTDAIPRPGLAAALQAWNKDRRQSLAQLLKEEAALDDERLRALECLASAHLRTHHNDLRLGLEAWNAYELTQDVLTEVGDDALRETLSMTLTGNTTLPVGRVTIADESDFKLSNPKPPGAGGRTVSTHQATRSRWNRPGLVGAGQRAPARGGSQGNSAEVRGKGRPASPVLARGGDHGQPGTSRHRARLQPGEKRRGPALLRDAVHPR